MDAADVAAVGANVNGSLKGDASYDTCGDACETGMAGVVAVVVVCGSAKRLNLQ